jgi:uncharacterized repeat protein (TIGR01451 family)
MVIAGMVFSLGALTVPVAAPALPARPAPTGRAATCPPPPTDLTNDGFEQPRVTTGTFQLFDQSQVPGWSTTAADGKMELWNSGFQGVPAAEGLQFAELNANLVSTLYQDVPTTPGQTLVWGLSHRGRNGVDVMNVRIGVPGNTLTTVATLSDGRAWGRHTGVYTVPAGQIVTRFAFESVSSAGGNPSIGNFLDAISFGTPSCVTAQKFVTPNGHSVNVGDQVDYRVQMSNGGGSATAAASVSDTLPANTTFVPGSILLNTGTNTVVVPDTAYNAGTRTISATFIGATGTAGVIEPGSTVALYYSVTADTAAAGTTLLNTANVSSTDGLGTVDAFTTNETATPVDAAADVQIVKSATPSAAANGTITYTLVVENNGPSSASNVVVTDAVPAGATITSAAGCTTSGQNVTCAVGTLANGASTTITITADAPDPTPSYALLINHAEVVASTFDPNRTNNVSEAATVVEPLPPALLEVTKTAITPTVNAGREAAVSILVTNVGVASTGSVTLTDTIPAGFTVTSATPSTGSCTVGATVSCSLGVLAGTNTVRIVVEGTTDPSLAAGATLTDTAAATDGTLTAGDTATITIANSSRLVTTKDTLNTPQADEPLVYAIDVSNLGPSDAPNAVITDNLPAGLTVTGIPDECTLTGTTLTCSLGTLAVGDIATIFYAAQVPVTGGTFTNTAAVTSDSTNPNPGDATSSKTSEVPSGADLGVTKTANRETANSGDTVTYTIIVTNNGPGGATGVTMRDDAASGITFTDVTADRGTIENVDGDRIWSIGTMTAGAIATLTTKATLTGTCDVPNAAFVSGDQDDLDGSDNTSIATVTLPGCAEIANTGLDAMPLTDTGLALMASGGGLMYLARRRRRGEPDCLA